MFPPQMPPILKKRRQQGIGIRDSISINIYANHAAGAKPPGTYVMAGTANLDNEPAVDRECRDANGGKHRFRIALPNQLLRTFQGKEIFVHGIALLGNVENALLAGSGNYTFPAPKWPPDPPTPNFLDGPRVAAFDTSKESCEQIDIPDAAARAFKDYKGTVHRIASHYVTRAGLGTALESAKHVGIRAPLLGDRKVSILRPRPISFIGANRTWR
jgi:hypothetical protein